MHNNIPFKKLSLLMAGFLLLAGCSKDNENSMRGIPNKGTISGNISKNAGSGTEITSSLADATQVLVFNSSGSYELFSIENNSFTARAMSGTASALAFLSADNSYIGCLHAGGLNVLPLVSLSDGENTVIDLSTLTLDGTRVIPANDPIGSTIALNEEELERYRQLGAFYESLASNIDADNDGKADLVDKKALYVSTIFDIYCGKWGLNGMAPEIMDTSRLLVNYVMRVCGGKSLVPSNSTITLSGPEGSPDAKTLESDFFTAPDGFIAMFRQDAPAPPGYPFGSVFLPFENGKYNLNLDGNNYSLYFSNVDAKYFFVLAIPTVHTNDQNEITSVSIEYRDTNGNVLDPENFVYQAMVQLNGRNYNQLAQIGVMWESPEAKTNTELYDFVPSRAIQVSELSKINVSYMDMLGNAYTIVFDEPEN